MFEQENPNPPSDSTLLQRMLSRSASLLQARGCGVLLWDRDKNHMTAMAPFAGLDEEQVAHGVRFTRPSPLQVSHTLTLTN